MAVSVLSILRQSSKFTGVNILSRFIGFPISIVIAMVLSPTDYGIIGYAGVIVTWAGFFNLGVMSSACREIPALVATGRITRARYLQNLAITAENFITLLVFIGLISITVFFIKDVTTKIILALGAFGYLFGRIYSFLEGINFAFTDFSLTAKGRLVRTIIYPILILSMIFWVKIYTPSIVGIICTIVVILYLMIKRNYKFAIVLNRRELGRLTKIGISMTGGTILYTLFTSTLDRTVIAAFLSKADLGLWVFCLSIVIIMLGVFKDFANVLKPVIWAEVGQSISIQEGFSPLKSMALSFSLSSGFITGIAQVGFIFLVNIVTIKFIDAQYIFLFISLYIFWEAMEKFPEIILYSEKVNHQNTVLWIWGICLVINILLDITAVKLGFGVIGIAIATVISQVISTFIMIIKSRKYLGLSGKVFNMYLVKIMTPFSLVLLITTLHWLSINYWDIDLPILIVCSVLFQLLMWYLFISIFYKEYKKIFSASKYLSLLKKS